MAPARNALNIIRSAGPDAPPDAPQLAAELFAQTWRTTGTRLKGDADASVTRATLAGRDVTIKVRALTSADRLKALVGHGRGDRHWDGAARLLDAHIPTARPYALFRGTLDGRHVEILVSEFLPGATLLACLASDDWLTAGPRAQHTLAHAAGRSIADLAGATGGGLFNRDHKPSNLIVTGWPHPPHAAPQAPPHIALLDTVAIRKHTGDHADARMLASLIIEPTGVGLAPRLRRSLLYRAALAAANDDRARAHRLYRAAAAIVREHGDPTPKINPLPTPPTTTPPPRPAS